METVIKFDGIITTSMSKRGWKKRDEWKYERVTEHRANLYEKLNNLNQSRFESTFGHRWFKGHTINLSQN